MPASAGLAINWMDSTKTDLALPDSIPSLHVLLTGATSQLGHALLPMLQAEGHRVTALSRDAHQDDAQDVAWHRADLAAGWPEVGECDVVVSFGPLQALADALAALSHAPCRQLVATSSMSAESKRDSMIPEDRALSASLRRAESALIAQCERLGIGWCVLRPTMIYGLGLDENLGMVARRAWRTRLFPYPAGRGLRQPVHAQDVALAAWHAANAAAAQGRIIEIGGGERLRIDEMFRRVRRSLPGWTLPLPVPRLALVAAARGWPALRGPVSRIDQDLLADNGPLRETLGVEPRGFAPDARTWRGEDA